MNRANGDYTAYLNGEWMPLSEVRIDPLDSGFTVGDVVFDLGRTSTERVSASRIMLTGCGAPSSSCA